MSYRSLSSRLSPVLAGVLLAAVAVPAWAPRAAKAEDPPKPAPKKPAGDLADRPNQVTGNEITPAQQQAVEKGLAWLSKRLTDSGGSLNAGIGGYSNHAGITALAGL